MRIDILREYVELARHLNYGAAAKSLHVSQSALSSHIISLEKELGVTLIDRGKPSTLTGAGRVFLNGAMRTLEEYDRAVAGCRAITLNARRRIRVGILPYIPAPSIVGNVLARIREFSALHHDVDFEIVPTLMEDIPHALRSGAIDCGYCSAVTVHSMSMHETPLPSGFEEFDLVPLCDVEIGVFVNATHPLAAYDAISPTQLQNVPLLIRTPATSREFCETNMNFLEQYGFTPVFDYQTAVSDEEMVLLKLDEGTAFITQKQVAEDSIAFGDDRVWVPFDPPHMSMCPMAFSREPANDAIAMFREFVRTSYVGLGS